MSSSLSLERYNKRFVKLSSNDICWLFLFLSYSFRVDKTNTFIRSRGCLEKIPISDHDGQNLYPFSDQKRLKKSIPLGRHVPI